MTHLTDMDYIIAALAQADDAGMTVSELLRLAMEAKSPQHLDAMVDQYSDYTRPPAAFIIASGPGDYVKVLSDLIDW